MNIAELLTSPGRWDHGEPVEMDALRETDALVEAAVLEVRMNAASGDPGQRADDAEADPPPRAGERA